MRVIGDTIDLGAVCYCVRHFLLVLDELGDTGVVGADVPTQIPAPVSVSAEDKRSFVEGSNRRELPALAGL